MKLTIGKKPALKAAAPTKPQLAKAKTKVKTVAVRERKRSPKELALLWFNDQMNSLVEKMKLEELEQFSDGATVNQTTHAKAKQFLAGRIDRVLMPVLKLLNKRSLL